jgi:DNA transformation protein
MSDDLIEHLRDLFAPLGSISARKMFGGYGLYLDGLIFGIVIEGSVCLKVDDETKQRFLAAGCAPFVYRSQKEPITMSYWSVPEEAMESPQDMLPWARLALGAAMRKANTPKKRKAARKR